MAITDFSKAVWEATKKIPRGKVATHAAIAKLIGRPKAARAVGNALNKNPFAPKVPCHRVVKSDGSLGGFAKGTKKKREMLQKEGVEIKNNKVVERDKIIYNLKNIF